MPPEFQDRESHIQAPYAVFSGATLGRLRPEPTHSYRGPFQRDRDRIIHCSAFRRLSEKMQVFTNDLGHYHRTRLTHTLEVTSVARTCGRALRLNEDLIEALALLHDIGHPPFGHTGEETLNGLLEKEGGFNHNRQALRIVEKLEPRYPEFFGLNLSRETLFGQEYRAVQSERRRAGTAASAAKTEPQTERYEHYPRAVLSPFLEAQVVDAADSISYDSHDADDALELGFLELDELLTISLWRRSAQRVRERWSGLTDKEFRRAVIHDLINDQVNDLLTATRERISRHDVESAEAVLGLPPLLGPSQAMAEEKSELERFLFERVYRHPKLTEQREKIRGRIEEVFGLLLPQVERLSTQYQNVLAHEGANRALADWIADQTDRFVREV